MCFGSYGILILNRRVLMIMNKKTKEWLREIHEERLEKMIHDKEQEEIKRKKKLLLAFLEGMSK